MGYDGGAGRVVVVDVVVIMECVAHLGRGRRRGRGGGPGRAR